MVDSTLAFDILARDRASSAFTKVAASADKTSAAITRSTKVNDLAAKAEARLSKARDAESDALGRVRVAETKLQELRDSGKAKASQILAAEEQLSSARRKAAQTGNTAVLAEKELAKARTQLAAEAASAGRDGGHNFGKAFGDGLDEEGGKSGKRFGASLKRWFTGDGVKVFGKAGSVSGEAFQSGLGGILKTPVLGPVVLAGLTAAVATAAPAAGAIAASGLITGFGAGLAGLGLVFAAKSQVVQSVWKKALTGMGADMRVLSKPFENTLLSMSVVARRTFDKFAPQLGAAFKQMAPAVTGFGDQLARAFEKLAPAIGPMSSAFAAVLKSLGPAMQSAIGNVSQGLIKLAESVRNSPDGLADLVKGIGEVGRIALDIITHLNDANAAFKRITDGTSAVTVVMYGLAGSLKGAEIAIRGVTAPVTGLDFLLQKVGLRSKEAGTSTGTFSSSLFAAAEGLKKTIAPAESLATKFERQKAKTDALITSLFRLQGLVLGLSGAQIAFQAAIDDATQSIKDNGKTLDINTAAGRANRTALNNVASAANQQTEAMIKSGKGTDAAGISAEKNKANFIRLATQMGLSKAAAKKMADQMIGIPNVSRTAKLQANKKDLEAKLAQAQKELKNPNLTKTRTAALKADIRNAKSGIATINGMLAGLPSSKTITVWTVNKTNPSGVGRRAAGGPVKAGMPYIVGEKRAEWFVPDQNGTILPRVSDLARHLLTKGNASTAMAPRPVSSSPGVSAVRARRSAVSMPTSRGGEQRIVLEIRTDGTPYGEFLAREIRKHVRAYGDGNVQKAFGR